MYSALIPLLGLEIGMPFTDPIADGPIIQAAMQRALSTGANQQTVLALGHALRRKSVIPMILFTYYNPLLQAGPDYLHQLAAAGFNGVLVNDLPLEEIEPHLKNMAKAGLDPILIATPATSPERLKKIASYSTGFIYYACQKGTTGLRKTLPEDLAPAVRAIKKTTSTPVVVGFGISSRENAQEVLKTADGFVVGSAFVQLVGKKAPPEDFKHLAQRLRLLDPDCHLAIRV